MKLTLAFALILLLSAGALADSAPHYQKPGAAIRLLNTDPIILSPNTEQSVTLGLSAPDNGELTLRIDADAGLVVAQDESTYMIDLANGDPTLTFTIKALEPGRFHIKFHASIDQGDRSSARVFGIAVQVGPEDPPSTTQKSAPKYIIMQGEESIY